MCGVEDGEEELKARWKWRRGEEVVERSARQLLVVMALTLVRYCFPRG